MAVKPLPLDYAGANSLRPSHRLWKWVVGAIVGLSFATYIVVHGPRTSADIRIDTGDVRYNYFGIPLEYYRMPEPERSQLLALGAGSKLITSKWRNVKSYPDHSYDHGEVYFNRKCYCGIIVWAAQDPVLARFLLDDLATNGYGVRFLWSDFVDFSINPPRLAPGWQHDPELLDYLAGKHYTIPSTQSVLTTRPQSH